MNKIIEKCNFCGSIDNALLYKDNSHLVVCNKCGLVYSKVRMKAKKMREFYNKDYFISKDAILKGYENYIENRADINKTFLKRIKIIEKYFSAPGKVLDVGCAFGFFLEIAKQRGWDVQGVDISEFCATFANKELGIRVRNDLFIDVQFGNDTFDLITMWDYLEHSVTPKEDIIKAHRLLKKGGILVMATPNIDSIPARVCKNNWIGIKLEEHFYYFSEKVLTELLFDVGFDVLKIGYAGKYISTRIFSERLVYYNKFLYHMLKKVLKKLEFSFYCNPFDIMFIICKKR